MKKIGISTPMVLTRETKPLQSVHFDVLGNGEPFAQWYYQNSGIFEPDRIFDNLILHPVFTAIVPETGTTINYPGNVSLSKFKWEWLEAGVWHTVQAKPSDITNVFFYYDTDKSLVIRRNVTPETAVQIKGTFEFADPRDLTVTYVHEWTGTLGASQDSDPVYPVLTVDVPNFQAFNPITDENDTCFHFPAKAKWGDHDISDLVQFEWYIIDKYIDEQGVTHEKMELADNVAAFYQAPDSMILPPEQGGSKDPNNPTIIQNGGQHSDCILVDAMWGEHLTIVCRARFLYTAIEEKDIPSGANPNALGWYERTVEEVVTPTGNPQEQHWYENIEGLFIHTEDTTVDVNKQYYIVSENLTDDTTAITGKVYYTTTGSLFPDAVHKTVYWEDFKMDVETYCGGGNAIRLDDTEKSFGTITTIRQGVLTEEQKSNHLLFKWKRRQSNLPNSQFIDCGTGNTITLTRNEMIGSSSWVNMNVQADAYLRGPYRFVTSNGSVVTFSGEVDETTYVDSPVYSRT